MARVFYALWLSGALLALTACTVFKPVANVPAHTYLLMPARLDIPAAKPGKLTLAVGHPHAIQAYNTKRMAYVKKPYEIAYFSENHWADTPADMLQPLMVEALQKTGRFRAVTAAPSIGQENLLLSMQLLRLQQVFLQSPSEVQLTLRAQLINAATRKIIATKLFTITQPAQQDTPYGGVVAANQAVAKLLKQLADFCVGATRHQ